jgi:tetratricopeptide (TPR) repeat protein
VGDSLSGCFHNRVLDYETAATFYRYKGEYDKAIEQYTRALEINPNGARIYNERGIIYSKKGDQEKAINDFNRSIKIKQDYAIAYVNRGLAFYRAGNKSRAIADYNKAIEIKSDTSNAILSGAYFNRGLLYSSEADCAKAISDFDNAAQANQTSVGNLVELALVLSTSPDGKCRDGARAVRLAEEALKISTTPTVLRALAAAYAETGMFEKAVSTQEEALALIQKGKTKPTSVAVEYYTRQLQSYKNSTPWREKASEKTSPTPESD